MQNVSGYSKKTEPFQRSGHRLLDKKQRSLSAEHLCFDGKSISRW